MSSGDPTISLAEQAHEKRPAAFNFVEDDGQHFTSMGLLFSNAPAEIYFREGDPAVFAKSSKTWKNQLHQHVPLSLHVTERRRDKEADLAIRRLLGHNRSIAESSSLGESGSDPQFVKQSGPLEKASQIAL